MGQEIPPMIPGRLYNKDGSLRTIEYECPHCKKWNSEKGVLEHIGNDYYKCDQCGRKYSRRDILNCRSPKEAYKEYTGDETIKMPECPPNRKIRE